MPRMFYFMTRGALALVPLALAVLVGCTAASEANHGAGGDWVSIAVASATASAQAAAEATAAAARTAATKQAESAAQADYNQRLMVWEAKNGPRVNKFLSDVKPVLSLPKEGATDLAGAVVRMNTAMEEPQLSSSPKTGCVMVTDGESTVSKTPFPATISCAVLVVVNAMGPRDLARYNPQMFEAVEPAITWIVGKLDDHSGPIRVVILADYSGSAVPNGVPEITFDNITALVNAVELSGGEVLYGRITAHDNESLKRLAVEPRPRAGTTLPVSTSAEAANR